jgi:lipopolysaccharide transport system permease protein
MTNQQCVGDSTTSRLKEPSGTDGVGSDESASSVVCLPPTKVSPQKILIEPARGWQVINFREIWQFRELLYFLAWRDIKVRYKQTALGAAWALIQPALMMVVFSIFFGRMAQVPTNGLPYPLFVYAGLLPWTFFASAISNAANSVIGSERLISKIYFPRLAIPIASVGSSVIDFVIALGLLIGLMLYYGYGLSAGLLAVPVLLGLLGLAALGVGTLLAALTVYYRDFRYVVPFAVQIGMFATPAVYMQPRSGTDNWMKYAVSLNPLNSIIDAFRAAFLGKPLPWGDVAIAAVVIVSSFLLGCLYFRHVEDQFADFI